MNIEITGCNDCPFKIDFGQDKHKSYECNLDENIQATTKPRNNIPKNCPIPKEEITIKPKQ